MPVTWYTSSDPNLPKVWAQAPSDPELTELLESAKEQCIVYATSAPLTDWIEPEAGIPVSWRRAQIMQAKALYNSTQAAPTDMLGNPTQTVRVYSMDATVKNLLRPQRSLPGIG
jgi:hypothetical protein